MSQLDVTRHGRIAVLTLKRPDHGNRVSQQMAEEVAAALDKVRTDAATGAAVLTGSSDVYYGMSGLGPAEALDMSRFALGVALTAKDKELR